MVVGHRPALPESLQLRPDEVHVWCVDLDVASQSAASLYASSLSAEERSRCARFRFPRDRQRFIVAHGVLRECLGGYLDVDPDRISYEHNAFGKPDQHARFGGRLRFNLSHSAGLALIAVVLDANIGVDIERIRATRELTDIAKFFFSPAELDNVLSLPSHRRCAAFFHCWTKKEAFLKACGVGLTIPPDAFSVPLDDVDAPTSGELELVSDAGGLVSRWSMRTLMPASDYIGALAVEGTGLRLRQWRWKTTTPRREQPRRIPA